MAMKKFLVCDPYPMTRGLPTEFLIQTNSGPWVSSPPQAQPNNAVRVHYEVNPPVSPKTTYTVKARNSAGESTPITLIVGADAPPVSVEAPTWPRGLKIIEEEVLDPKPEEPPVDPPPVVPPISTVVGKPVPTNYTFYDWKGDDYNKELPEGAPWGGIYVLPWGEVHVDQGKFSWVSTDTYFDKMTAIGRPVIIQMLCYESDIPGRQTPPFKAVDPTKKVYPLYFDLTPNWLRDRIGSQWIKLDGLEGRQWCCPLVGGKPDPQYEYAAAIVPNYLHPDYAKSIKELAIAMGAKYNKDPRLQGIIVGFGMDAEFGEFSKGAWGDCKVRDNLKGFPIQSYLQLGLTYIPWFAEAFPDKPVYHQLTSTGKEIASRQNAMPYNNLGIKQASLAYDHTWFRDSRPSGILDCYDEIIGRKPIGCENALWILRDENAATKRQQMLRMLLVGLRNFPDFFDWTSGVCFDKTFGGMELSIWARQYYGRNPVTTNEIFWVCQETANHMPASGGAVRYGGLEEDYEYGLYLKTPIGKTIWRSSACNKGQGLKELFSQEVADQQTGQARLINAGEIFKLASNPKWIGIGKTVESTITSVIGGKWIETKTTGVFSGEMSLIPSAVQYVNKISIKIV